MKTALGCDGQIVILVSIQVDTVLQLSLEDLGVNFVLFLEGISV